MSAPELTKEQKAKKYQTEYKVAHREQHAKYMKSYVAASPGIACPCGGQYKAYCAYRHNKTAKHLKFLEAAKAQAEEAKTAEVVAVEVVADPVPLVEFELDVTEVGKLKMIQLKEKPVEEKVVKKSKKIVVEEMFHVPPAEVIAVEPSTPTVGTKRPKPKKTCPNPEKVNFVI